LRTSENQKTFLLPNEASPEDIFKAALDQFARINDERHLEHP
jgi:hypothetical protein